MIVLTMHGIGHTIAQVFGKFIACTIFYCKYPGIKLQNWDAATCRTLVYIHLFGFFFFLYRPLGRNLDTQDRPLWFLSLFSFGPSMASEAISEHLIFVGGMPLHYAYLHHCKKGIIISAIPACKPSTTQI